MRFYYEWDDSELTNACFELERRQIVEHYWRVARRRLSITCLLLVPLLAALLAASFVFLSRRQVSGGWSVLAVAVLGGLLGGVLVSLRRLVALVRARLVPLAFTGRLPWLLLLAPLLAGTSAGAASAFLLISASGVEAYRPQTLYLIGLGASIVWSRLAPVGMVSVTSSGTDERA
jgi:hypothetical protein